MNEKITGFMTYLEDMSIPESIYDINKKEYLVKNILGQWIPFAEHSFKRFLKEHGLSDKAKKNSLSPIDKAIRKVQHERGVYYVGPLAGYDAGIHEVYFGQKILVTTSPVRIKPQAGNFPLLQGLIEGMLGAEQISVFWAWLKQSHETFASGEKYPGQVLFLCGPRNCGKSLLQKIITEVLGGRSARPYQYMTGGTPFNADLFGAEHQVIEDEQPSTDIRTRRAFGTRVKIITATDDQRMHGKGRDGLLLRPFWRMTASINDEPENIMVVPPLDESILDKIIILRCERRNMPMPTGSPTEKRKFWQSLQKEIPALIHFISVEFQIPDEMKCSRFGIRSYQNPEIVEMLNETSPEDILLEMIDEVYFIANETVSLTLSAQEIQAFLTSSPGLGQGAKRLLDWNSATTTYLRRLAKKRPDRIESCRTSKRRLWKIYPPQPDATATVIKQTKGVD